MDLPRPLRGIIPPMVTPLDADRLDVAAVERLVEHVLSGGVQGLFILGTTGEGTSLAYELRRELIERVCRQVMARVPVLVAITDTSRRESIDLANFAAGHGASALVLAAPYYYPLTQSELAAYVERLAPHLPLPFYLYNMPSHTKVAFAPETVRRLADVPNLYGLKDSSGNLDYFEKVCDALRGRTDFALLMGPEELLVDAMRLGAHGGVSGGANLWPELYVKLYRSAYDGDAAETQRLQDIVLRIGRGVYAAAPNYLAGLKCALGATGICQDTMAEPFERASAAIREQITKTVKELGLVKHRALAAAGDKSETAFQIR